jgi:hypothetical protein
VKSSVTTEVLASAEDPATPEVVVLGSEAAGSETEGSAETPEVEVLGPEVAGSEAAVL